MTLHILPVPQRLSMVHQQDPDLIEAVLRARRKLALGEDISDVPFDLRNVLSFKRRPVVTWPAKQDKPLFQRMVEARESGQ